MTHFSEAKIKAIGILKEADYRTLGKRWCLIRDIRGVFRLLIEPAEGVERNTLDGLCKRLSSDLGAFWSDEIWFSGLDVSPAEKAVYDKAWVESQVIDSVADSPEIRELERLLSKDAWFGKPLKPPWLLNDSTPPIISFFSFKGGVGRTTALASVAIQLARKGKRVCVVDLDLEAPGIGNCFPMLGDGPEYGTLDYILESDLQRDADMPIEEYVGICDDTTIIGKEGAHIYVVPAGRLDDDYLEKLARVDYRGLSGDEAKSPLHRLFNSLRRKDNIEYFLVDARSGLHDIGGLTLNGFCHLDVLFGIENTQSWAGLALVVSHVGGMRDRDLPQQDCAIVYAMAPSRTDKDREERERVFLEKSFDLFGTHFYDSEPEGGWPADIPEDAWPLPSQDDADQPHYPIVLSFLSDIHRADSLLQIADVLTEGDYKELLRQLLVRVDRTTP
jgi:cellulose biosynthesis protein BcsQ